MPGWPSLALVILLLAVLPWLAARSHRSGRALALPRSALYLSTSVTQWLLVVLLAGVLWWEGGGASSLGLGRPPAAAPAIAWTVGTVAAGLAIGAAAWALRTGLGQAETPTVRHLIPRTAAERRLFALVVAPTAGAAEELLYRGFAISRLAHWTGLGSWPSAAVVAVGFALGHFYQGTLGLARAGLLGLVLAAPLLATGSLVPSILAHAALDLLGGLVLGRYVLDEPTTSGAAAPPAAGPR